MICDYDDDEKDETRNSVKHLIFLFLFYFKIPLYCTPKVYMTQRRICNIMVEQEQKTKILISKKI